MLIKTHGSICVNWGIVSYMLYGGYVDDDVKLILETWYLGRTNKYV